MPSRIHLRPRTTPSPPPSGREVVFLDAADSVLKSIDSAGTVTDVEGGGGGGATFPVTETGAEDETVDLSISATASGGVGEALVNREATGTDSALIAQANTTVTSDGDAYADTTVTSSGVEDAFATVTATTVGGSADVTRTAVVTGGGEGSAFANTNANSDGDAQAITVATSTTGSATARTEAESTDGAADVSATAYSPGAGNALANNLAVVDGAGLATASIEANGSGGNAFVKVVADATSARIGFFQTTPIAKPTGVAVTAEAIHAALVSLGLIAA